MINPHVSLRTFGASLFLFIFTGCAATPMPRIASTSIPSTPTLYITPTIQATKTPESIYASLPIISPVNAHDIKEIVRVTKGIISQAIWSPDGKYLAVSTTIGAYLYDVKSGEELQHFDTNSSPSIAISPDSNLIAIGEGNVLSLWELRTGQKISTLHIEGKKTQQIVFINQHTLLVESIVQFSQGEGDTPGLRSVQAWDFATGEHLYTLLGREQPEISPDGQLLAVFFDGKVEFWNTTTGQFIDSIAADFEFKFSPDGHSIAIVVPSPTENTIILFDTQSWQTRCTFKVTKDYFYTLGFSPDGKQLATSDGPGKAQVWDTTNCQQRYSIFAEQTGDLDLRFSPKNQFLASYGFADHTLKFWDAATGQLKNTLDQFYGRMGDFSPDGNFIVEQRQYQDTIAIWNTETGKLALILDKHTSQVGSIAFSPDGNLLATGHANGEIHVWSLYTNQIQKTITVGYDTSIKDLAFHPNGQNIAAGITNGKIEGWDAASGASLFTLSGHASNSWVTEIAFSPDGKTLASNATDSTIRLWDVETDQVRFVFILPSADNTSHMAFSPDGKTLAIAASDKWISLWDVNNEQLLSKPYIPTNFNGAPKLVFHPNGHILYAVDYSGIWMWDVTTKNPLATLEIENAGTNISSAAISPDGEILAIAATSDPNYAYEIKLWDLNTKTLLTTLTGHTDWIPQITFSPDGRLLASASADGTARLWGIKK